MSPGPWVVDDYRTPAGGRPVRDFLGGLSKGARPKVYAVLAMLEARGNQLAMPQSKAMGDGLYELRIAHQRDRSACCIASARGAGSSCSMVS